MPNFLKKLFWDTSWDSIDIKKHADYIISRILEFGDIKSVRWMLKTYERERIIHTLKHSRDMSSYSANFWASFFDIKFNEILCLSKRFQRQHRKIWNY